MALNETLEQKEYIDVSSFKNELNFLKKEIINNKEILNDKINSKEEFKDFLLEKGLNDFDRSLPFGRYLRVLRYEDNIKEISKKHGVPSYVPFVLAMIESQGNPGSMNLNDGGAGILHFQANVGREYGLRVFTDSPEYTDYNISKMESFKRNNQTIYINSKGQEYTLSEIYAEHARILKELGVGENKLTISELEELDERFNSTKCINASCKYLAKIKKNNVDKNYAKKTSNKSRDKYKDDETKFKRILAANGFNKGPTNFTKNFESGSHVSNYMKNLKYYENYEERLDILLKQGLTGDEILAKLEFPLVKTEIENSEKGREYFKYEGPSIDSTTISQVFDKWDQKHNNNIYKNTGSKNIIKNDDGFSIKAKRINAIQEDEIITEKTEETTKIKNNESAFSYRREMYKPIQKENKETSKKDKGPFEYLNPSKDKKYNVYSYTTKKSFIPGMKISYNEILYNFTKVGGKKIGTIISKSNGDPYEKNTTFTEGQKIYIKEKID